MSCFFAVAIEDIWREREAHSIPSQFKKQTFGNFRCSSCWPNGKAPDYGSGDSGFESRAGLSPTNLSC